MKHVYRCQKKTHILSRIVSSFIAFTFLCTLVLPPAYAQTILNLPEPGAFVPLSDAHVPCLLEGVTVYYDQPFKLDFILDTGQEAFKDQDQLRDQSRQLIKYFLAALTIPEDELWVNLSPYEEGKIIAENFSRTEMGRDMLAQDYLLKQLSSSLIYPQEQLGQEFWQRVYAKAHEKYGTTEIPLNTFNKVWILPETAVVYERGIPPTDKNPSWGRTALVVESRLKVMMEEDYLAMKNHLKDVALGTDQIEGEDIAQISDLTSEVYKEIVLPEIEREVNEGTTFANLRQIFNSMILAIWYKQNLEESILGQVYADKNKVAGIDVADKEVKQKIYNQYLEALKTGVFNYIKEDFDEYANEPMPRKYFSGGLNFAQWARENLKTVQDLSNPAHRAKIEEQGWGRKFKVVANLAGMSAQQIKDAGGLQNLQEETIDQLLQMARTKEIEWLTVHKITMEGDDVIVGNIEGLPAAMGKHIVSEIIRNIKAEKAFLVKLSQEKGQSGQVGKALLEQFRRQMSGKYTQETNYIHIHDRPALAEALGIDVKDIPQGHASDLYGRNVFDTEAFLHESGAGLGLSDLENILLEALQKSALMGGRVYGDAKTTQSIAGMLRLQIVKIRFDDLASQAGYQPGALPEELNSLWQSIEGKIEENAPGGERKPNLLIELAEQGLRDIRKEQLSLQGISLSRFDFINSSAEEFLKDVDRNNWWSQLKNRELVTRLMAATTPMWVEHDLTALRKVAEAISKEEFRGDIALLVEVYNQSAYANPADVLDSLVKLEAAITSHGLDEVITTEHLKEIIQSHIMFDADLADILDNITRAIDEGRLQEILEESRKALGKVPDFREIAGDFMKGPAESKDWQDPRDTQDWVQPKASYSVGLLRAEEIKGFIATHRANARRLTGQPQGDYAEAQRYVSTLGEMAPVYEVLEIDTGVKELFGLTTIKEEHDRNIIYVEKAFLRRTEALGNPFKMRQRAFVYALTQGEHGDKKIASYEFAIKEFGPERLKEQTGFDADRVFKKLMADTFPKGMRDERMFQLTRRRTKEYLWEIGDNFLNLGKTSKKGRRVIVHPDDSAFDSSDPQDGAEDVKICYLNSAANPLHNGHFETFLRAMAYLDITQFIIGVDGRYRPKPITGKTEEARHSISSEYVRDFFDGILAYSSWDKGRNIRGEDSSLELFIANSQKGRKGKITMYYLHGSDHRHWFYPDEKSKDADKVRRKPDLADPEGVEDIRPDVLKMVHDRIYDGKRYPQFTAVKEISQKGWRFPVLFNTRDWQDGVPLEVEQGKLEDLKKEGFFVDLLGTNLPETTSTKVRNVLSGQGDLADLTFLPKYIFDRIMADGEYRGWITDLPKVVRSLADQLTAQGKLDSRFDQKQQQENLAKLRHWLMVERRHNKFVTPEEFFNTFYKPYFYNVYGPSGEIIRRAERRIHVTRKQLEQIFALTSDVEEGTASKRQKPPGGIDFSPALFALEVRRDEKGAPLPLPQQPIYNLQFDGFVPVIIEIIPIPNLNMLLGGGIDIIGQEQLSRR